MLEPACNEQLPADLYPDGCNAQVQVCGLQRGHSDDHRAWVQMAPTIVTWPIEADGNGSTHAGGER